MCTIPREMRHIKDAPTSPLALGQELKAMCTRVLRSANTPHHELITVNQDVQNKKPDWTSVIILYHHSSVSEGLNY